MTFEIDLAYFNTLSDADKATVRRLHKAVLEDDE